MSSLARGLNATQAFASDKNPSDPFDAPPVQTAPSAAPLEPPPPAADAPQLPEKPGTERDPVREAEQAAIKQRLAEMERAEELAQEYIQQQPRFAAEPQRRQAPEIPTHVQHWINSHPEYFNDHVKLAELQLASAKCARDGLGWEDPDFVPTVERHLGHKQEARPNGNNGQVYDRPPVSAPTPAPPLRNSPPRQAENTRANASQTAR